MFPFRSNRAFQAVAVLLKTEPERRMTRLRLLKLLYIAERESLLARGRPIVGDRVVAMDHGPVLSNTYNLIKGTDYSSPTWDKYFKNVGSREIQFLNDPGVGDLTRWEIEKLQEVATRYCDTNDWAVADVTHQYSEWQKNKPAPGSCNDIPLDDVLEALGIADRKLEIADLCRGETAIDHLLS